MLTAGIDYTEPEKLTYEDLTEGNTAFAIIESMDDYEAEKYISKVLRRGKELGLTKKELEGQFAAMKRIIRGNVIKIPGTRESEINNISLAWTDKGVAVTTDNFMKIMRQDEYYSTLRFNELTNSPEHEENGRVVRWNDADDSAGQHRIELIYGIYNRQKYETAFQALTKERKYNPVKDLIESVTWDGSSRIETMLHKWMGVEDTPYSREVSRLIFAGGINRLYRPGCKFDDMPILIGTKQGEGKSTFVRFLALSDDFFREITEINGQQGAEAVEGAWICEMSELLALTRTKEVEAVKSYITRQKEVRRKAYGHFVGEYPRQCIFIGTTNRRQFLTDKTGNRRFYPVVVNSSGYELYAREEELREDVKQCWAEALTLFNQNKLPPYANSELISEIRKEQDEAVEDDWRVELIKDYVEQHPEFCIRQVWNEALGLEGVPTKKDSTDISMILQGISGVCRAKTPKRIGDYGLSKYWINANYNASPKAEQQRILEKFNEVADGSDIEF